jgi:hypothetical protein
MLGNGCPTPRKDGAACQASLTRSGFSLAHDPGLEGKRWQARARGGKDKARTVRARKLLMTEEPQVIPEAH